MYQNSDKDWDHTDLHALLKKCKYPRIITQRTYVTSIIYSFLCSENVFFFYLCIDFCFVNIRRLITRIIFSSISLGDNMLHIEYIVSMPALY